MNGCPALVFIHGGMHDGGSWDDTVAELAARRPDLHTHAVDLPGRRSVAGDLSALTLSACADSVTEQIRAAVDPRQSVVLIGHSLAGVVIPGVVNRLGVDRIARIVFVACCVPRAGKSVFDTIPAVVREPARRVLRGPVIDKAPFVIERFIFGAGATAQQRARIRECIRPESAALIKDVPEPWEPCALWLGWVLPVRDRALPKRLQRSFIADLGGMNRVATIDAGHEVLVTHPRELAELISSMVDE